MTAKTYSEQDCTYFSARIFAETENMWYSGFKIIKNISVMSSKNYYQNQIDSIKRDISKLKSEIVGLNAKIKDYQKQKVERKATAKRQIASTSSSSSKSSYRSSLQASLQNIDSSIASLRSQIDQKKRAIASKQSSLKQAQESKKRATK
jgi:SMC interacting uncharacterized protein involved in chromosome segregation